MPAQHVNPTRMELLRLKKRSTLAARGHKLLKEKRDGLMREFLALIKETRELRARVDEDLGQALTGFTLAQATMDPQAVKLIADLTSEKISVRAEEKNIMGVRVPKFAIGRQADSGQKYLWWETSPELDVALAIFEKVLPDLLRLAELEKTATLLAEEIETTRRRVNALEHVLLPQLQATTRYIRMKLEEQARAALTTTMKVKQQIT